jgi:hypothetical protein
MNKQVLNRSEADGQTGMTPCLPPDSVPSSTSLEQLLRSQPQIWRGLRNQNQSMPTIASGFAELDALLPGGGWPSGAVMEMRLPRLGIGELRLLLPALSSLSLRGRWIIWLAPPHQPYAPALLQAGIDLQRVLVVDVEHPNDIPWALEKLLRSGRCGIALAWPARLSNHQCRRLQLAAEQGGALAVLFLINPQNNAVNSASSSSAGYAALCIEAKPASNGLALNIIKARGNLRRESLILPL